MHLQSNYAFGHGLQLSQFKDSNWMKSLSQDQKEASLWGWTEGCEAANFKKYAGLVNDLKTIFNLLLF